MYKIRTEYSEKEYLEIYKYNSKLKFNRSTERLGYGKVSMCKTKRQRTEMR